MTAKRREGLGTLPVATAGFVGRERELDRISTSLLGTARLVTLIGSGGIGKTRLAEEAVRRLHRARQTPVFLVRLARLSKDSTIDAVKETIATTLLDPVAAGASAWHDVLKTLSSQDAAGRYRQSVLVLDNCEHVLDAVGEVIAELLQSVPALMVVATSREPIGWIDEQLIAVAPLSAAQSLELFKQRAALTGHPITTADETAIAKQICRHLHGHPLYIRLAAARTFYEPLPLILQQLSGDDRDMRMSWEHGPRVGADRRHRSINDVIAWSYDLCDDKERLLFDRLSKFAAGPDPGFEVRERDVDMTVRAGGADLDAVEWICADPSPDEDADSRCVGSPQLSLRRDEIRGLLDRLVEKSLVEVHISRTAARYSLTESLHLFAQQRLAQRSTDAIDEPDRMARRHRRYYLNKLEQARNDSTATTEQPFIEWGQASWDNIRLAVESSLAVPGEAQIGLRIAVDLIALNFPFSVSAIVTIRRWAETALAAARAQSSEPSDLYAAASAMIGWLAMNAGDTEGARQMLDECFVRYLPEPGQREHASASPEDDAGLPPEIDFFWGIWLGHINDVRSIPVLERAVAKFHACGDSKGEYLSQNGRALAYAFLDAPDKALVVCKENLQRVAASGMPRIAFFAELALATAQIKAGQTDEALAAIEHMLRQTVIPARNRFSGMRVVCLRMWALARIINDERASDGPDKPRITALAKEIAQLAGGVKTLNDRLGIRLGGMFKVETVAAIAVAREVLSPDEFRTAQSQGAQLRPEQDAVIMLALGSSPTTTAAPTESVPPKETFTVWNTLSDAEKEVAILAAAGWPNSAIGARRGTATKTVDAQMSSIFHKLTINSREEIIRAIPSYEQDRLTQEQARRPRRQGEKPRGVRTT
ncbi:helix-turn-helix transcriptional regulator [Nocardia sp. CDC160]|uniref:helix-turn-helix transcriptional regulator n=1 Tax=Nocardia sp. CDC160 TaxID=3112166 RepID=UPI002DBEF31E|nr:AAA family ATPase [Nocardia sp. CDC160]MEC3919257.1 AAA family ATPase [Nocardia sp. CDC160]